MMDTVQIAHYATGETLYFHVVDGEARRWNGTGFEAYDAGRWGYYDVALAEQGASRYYVGTFPALAPGRYAVVCFRQGGASPAESDEYVAVLDAVWDGAAFLDVSDLVAHGDAAWSTVSAETVAGAVLADTNNKLVTNGLGQVEASNMRGTDDAYTGTPPTVNEIAAGVWSWATRTLSSYGTLVQTIVAGVWAAATRTLTAIGFEVTATGVSDVKAVTDKLGEMVEPDGDGYRYTALALAEGPVGGDATASAQADILAAVGGISVPTAETVAQAVLGATVDVLDVQTVLQYLLAANVGKAVRTSAAPVVVEFYDRAGAQVLFTLTQSVESLREPS